jgi:hypothetical protein
MLSITYGHVHRVVLFFVIRMISIVNELYRVNMNFYDMRAFVSCLCFQVITRDCSTSWPIVNGGHGLQKLLDSDVFICDESL